MIDNRSNLATGTEEGDGRERDNLKKVYIRKKRKNLGGKKFLVSSVRLQLIFKCNSVIKNFL